MLKVVLVVLEFYLLMPSPEVLGEGSGQGLVCREACGCPAGCC